MQGRRNCKSSKMVFWIVGIIVVVLMITISKIYGNIEVNTYEDNVIADRISNSTIADEETKNKTVVEMLESSMPTIVGISKIKNNGITVLGVDSTSQLGIGSGVIISEKGYILTNEHVSGSKYSSCYVTLENGSALTANVVWSDSSLDLSIIKVNQQFAIYAKLGDSEDINVGETVYAIGNPIGVEFQRTVTSGIISAINRAISFNENDETVYMDNLIQTDATINPGNSGGPLLNIYGEIIGINTVKITSAEGIGFAMPINIIKPIIQKFEETGKFEEATIGILGYDKNVSKYVNSGVKFDNGIYVSEVLLNSSAKNKEIKVGDIITKVDDINIDKMADLRKYVYEKNPGDEIKLKVIRNNREIEITAKLGRKL